MLFGLNWRDQLPPVVADELDALISKVSAFMSVAHNEDGSITNIGTAFVPWTDVPTIPGMFSGTGTMAWTVVRADISYMVMNDTMLLNFYVANSATIAPADTGLQISIPGGYRAVTQTFGTYTYSDDGATDTSGYAEIVPDSNVVRLIKINGTAWAVPATLTTVRGQILFHVMKQE